MQLPVWAGGASPIFWAQKHPWGPLHSPKLWGVRNNWVGFPTRLEGEGL